MPAQVLFLFGANMRNLPVRLARVVVAAGLVVLTGCSSQSVPTKPVNNDVIQIPKSMPDGDPLHPKGKASGPALPKGAGGMTPPPGLPGAPK
jgi:hypothetical protein